MGQASSDLRVLLSTAEVAKVVEVFCLTPREVSTLHQAFKEGDKDNSGHLNASEFHLLFSESVSPFLTHLFVSQDINHDQNLAFHEFLALVSGFCCYSEPEMVYFAFKTFDTDNSGTINEGEIKEFIRLLDESAESGGSEFPKAATRALQMFDSDGDGTIDYEEFVEMNLRFPHLLWPAFRLQFRIQEKTLGLNSWKAIQKRVREKGKEKKLGPRPVCPYCFCLARPVLREKKSRPSIAASKAVKKASVVQNSQFSNKKSRKSIISSRAPFSEIPQDSEVEDKRRSSVFVTLNGRPEFGAPRGSIAQSQRRGSIQNSPGVENSASAATGAVRNPLSGRSQSIHQKSFDIKNLEEPQSASAASPISPNSSDQRLARRRQSEHPRGSIASKVAIKQRPVPILARVNENGQQAPLPGTLENS